MADDETQLPLFSGASRVQRRLIDSSVQIEADDPDSINFQHTVFCQTGLPYRNPGKASREWERLNGRAHLKVLAGEAMDPEQSRLVQLGLPFGPKPRLILIHLNTEAVRTGSPDIEVEDSMTAFVRRLQRRAPTGPELKVFKTQLASLAAATVRLGLVIDQRAVTINTQIVHAFDLWFPKDSKQRVLWPSTVRLSLDYFESLAKHAVPLDERAVASLAHSSMALDIYCWLAQRLHRVDPRRPQLIPWVSLKEQFGWHYGRMDNFKRAMRHTLDVVLTQYRSARLELDDRGLTIRNSQPPISERVRLIG